MEEKSAFRKVFGNSPTIKVIDFLLAERGLYDYTLSDISRNSGVSWSTLHRIFPELVENGIVEQTRSIANAKLYRLNEKNPIAQELIRIDNKISDYFIQKELETQKTELKHSLPG
ncbi:MAG: winged helix-turn-helix domain-containing protein [Candidatus Altiarchaeota archaeon]|nr:winged helix-turn-helix domain-containing protein [Candidatus Altiarchaeota archaeon]